MAKKRYLCSVCHQPRIPSDKDPEVLLCGRCDLVDIPVPERPKQGER